MEQTWTQSHSDAAMSEYLRSVSPSLSKIELMYCCATHLPIIVITSPCSALTQTRCELSALSTPRHVIIFPKGFNPP